MPDAKYSDNKVALKYSGVKNYFKIMKATLKEMYRQVGDLIIEKGIARHGLLVRHLVLPNNLSGPKKFLNFLLRFRKKHL